MECSCMELALEGERLCKAGDCKTGVQFFEAAVQAGTDDLKTLGAIYSQLGNAYFYLQEYDKALEFHKHDLNMARALSDRVGEAKASGNLGNTLKVIGKFDDAITCCNRHLDISREINDKVGESRALYNLGNVFHTKGKHVGKTGKQDPGDFPPEVKDCLLQATHYYEGNLKLVRELRDEAAQGRACGNLGNTHYLLGNFTQAINYHEERLAIAKQFGDKAAERRAFTNLGNAHIFLGEFELAADHYKRSLHLAKQIGDKALEAQACYSLGNTYTLLRNYEKAIEYHMLHLEIAQELDDVVGQSRACWSLGNAHSAVGYHQTAIEYATKHLQLSQQIGDENGQVTAKMNLADLRSALGMNCSSAAEHSSGHDNVENDETSVKNISDIALGRKPGRARRHSMENMELVEFTPDKSALLGDQDSKQKILKAVTTDSSHAHHCRKASDGLVHSEETNDTTEEDNFLDLLSRFQSRRIDEQRCSFRSAEDNAAAPLSSNGTLNQSGNEELLDMVAGIQESRMNDQRAELSILPRFPGLNSQEVIGQFFKQNEEQTPDDDFLEMLMRSQATRLNDQRSALPPILPAPTIPDDDFFNLIQKVQSSRLEEQRTDLPKKKSIVKPSQKN